MKALDRLCTTGQLCSIGYPLREVSRESGWPAVRSGEAGCADLPRRQTSRCFILQWQPLVQARLEAMAALQNAALTPALQNAVSFAFTPALQNAPSFD